MSLATRCSACGTVFRVVQDQLRVSGGWVRCGRCSEVFNAIESLLDLEGDRPTEPAALLDTGPIGLGEWAQPRAAASTESATARVAGTPPGGRAAASMPAPPVVRAEAKAEPPAEAIEAPPPDATKHLDLRGEPVSAATPTFVRQAERAARWRTPIVRAALAMLAVMSAALLCVQVSLAWHDVVAARWSALAPLVGRLCEWQGCQVGPPRRIDRLTVDSSGLARSGPGDLYRLSVVMRNREPDMDLRLPSIDLALTDAQGQPLARRTFDPRELGAKVTRIAPGAELALAATLRIDAGQPAGYTIELFYP